MAEALLERPHYVVIDARGQPGEEAKHERQTKMRTRSGAPSSGGKLTLSGIFPQCEIIGPGYDDCRTVSAPHRRSLLDPSR